MADANLNENLNIVSESGLDIQLLDGDLNIIQKLDDEPNDVGGMTSAELKATFDKAGNIIKDYLNNQLVPAILAADATEAARSEAEAARQSAETGREQAETERVSAEEARASAEETRQSNETARKNAETSREDAETGRSSAEGQRASAEGQRASAEVSRVTAEENRVTAEQNRAEAERLRSAADRNRDIAETQRIAAEEDRASAEAARSVWEDYNAGKAYVPGNKVAYEGSSYLNISACAGIEPTNTDYWLLIARKGDSGTGDGGGDYLPTSGGSLYGALYFRAEGQTLVAAKLQGDYAAVNDNSEDDFNWGELPDDRQMLRLSKLLYIACTAGECGLNLNGGRICKVGDPTYTMDVANKRYVDGQKYTLPIASSTKLGGVQPAAKTDAMTQAVGVDDAGALWTAPGGGSAGSDWKLIRKITVPGDPSSDTSGIAWVVSNNAVKSIDFDTDDNGEAFSVKELYIATTATNIDSQTAATEILATLNGKNKIIHNTNSSLVLICGKTGESGRAWMYIRSLNPPIILTAPWITTNTVTGKTVQCVNELVGFEENGFYLGEKITKISLGGYRSVSYISAGSVFEVYGR